MEIAPLYHIVTEKTLYTNNDDPSLFCKGSLMLSTTLAGHAFSN